MRRVVMGGSGFVGGAICRRLDAHGIPVAAVDAVAAAEHRLRGTPWRHAAERAPRGAA